jgi:phenylacetate-coenzyme A ligase PaaK-like adenylate-forming protein
MSNWQRLQRMPRAEQKAMQDHLLRRYVNDYLVPFSPWYRALFEKAGVRPEQIRCVDDLRRLPLSQKRDLLPTADEPQRSSSSSCSPTLPRSAPPGRSRRSCRCSGRSGRRVPTACAPASAASSRRAS